jgi:hypothetical protein
MRPPSSSGSSRPPRSLRHRPEHPLDKGRAEVAQRGWKMVGELVSEGVSGLRIAAVPVSGRAWSTFGPYAIGAERFVAVSSGLQR